jgi:hypothetical protein
MTKLAISLATRGRPQQLIDTITKSVANWTNPETVMWVMCDNDDKDTQTALIDQMRHPAVHMSTKPREDTIAEKWNRIIDLEPDADLYLVAADDDPYVTPGYDQKLLDAAARFPDGIGMVYGHMANASFSGVVAPTSGLVQKLGHIFPTYFPYWFVDHWTDDVARLIDRISFADVRTDQSRAGKTQEMREPGWWATWFDAAYLMRRKIAHDIVDGFSWPVARGPEYDRIKSCAPLIEYRSRWVNDQVRANSQHYERWSGLSTADARYQRVKQRAIDMIPHLLDDYGMDPAEAAMFRNALIPTKAQPVSVVTEFRPALQRWA